jgi:hypothetical protein
MGLKTRVAMDANRFGHLAYSRTMHRFAGRCASLEPIKNVYLDLSHTSGPTARPCGMSLVSGWLSPVTAPEP